MVVNMATIDDHERKVCAEFTHLLEQSKSLFNGLRSVSLSLSLRFLVAVCSRNQKVHITHACNLPTWFVAGELFSFLST